MNSRVRNIALILALLLIFYFSITVKLINGEIQILETNKALLEMLQAVFKSIFSSEYSFEVSMEENPFWIEVLSRMKRSIIVLLSGMTICFGGTIFQTIFKNPMASPNILGVATGVSIGNILFVITYGTLAYRFMNYRYLYCYLLSILIVLVTVLSGRLVNRKSKIFSTEVMIIMGMVVTHLGQVFVTYYQYLLAGDETGLLEIYTNISNGDTIYIDSSSFTLFIVSFLLSVLPMIFIKYKFNSVAFPDDEMSSSGVSNEKLRVVGLLCGSIMAAVALIHCGQVGFLSMAIPFMARTKKNVDFRGVVLVSCLLGGILTLIARIIITIAYGYGWQLPASVPVSLLVIPLFIYFVAKRESAFE